MIDGMLLGIRKNLGTRSLAVALLACAPLLAISGMAHAAPTPGLRVSPARVANPSTHAISSYTPSKARAKASPRTGGSLPKAHPLISGPGTGPQLIQDPGFEFGVGNPYWPEYSQAGFEIITPTNPHSGRYSVDLCGYTNDTPACLDRVSQSRNFTVPSPMLGAGLAHWFG